MVFYEEKTHHLQRYGKSNTHFITIPGTQISSEYINATERYLWGKLSLSLLDTNLGRKVILKESFLF